MKTVCMCEAGKKRWMERTWEKREKNNKAKLWGHQCLEMDGRRERQRQETGRGT